MSRALGMFLGIFFGLTLLLCVAFGLGSSIYYQKNPVDCILSVYWDCH
jgi:hypothetical protein